MTIPSNSDSDKTAVLILGAPRSGTSAVSQVLSEMGVHFGDPARFVDPAVQTHNPIFYELQSVNDFNARIMAHMGYEYGDFDCFPDAVEPGPALVEQFADEVRGLIEQELGGHALIGLKDPRFAFTLPVWETALQQSGYSIRYLVTERSIDAVVDSNAKVNTTFTRAHNYRIAIISMGLSALRVEGKAHLLVKYDDLVDNSLAEALRIAEWLGLDHANTNAAAQVVQSNLRHQGASDGSASTQSPEELLAAWSRAYRDLRSQLVRDGLMDLLDSRRVEVVAQRNRISELEHRVAQSAAAGAQALALELVEQRFHARIDAVERRIVLAANSGDSLRSGLMSAAQQIEDQAAGFETLRTEVAANARSTQVVADGLAQMADRVSGIAQMLTTGQDRIHNLVDDLGRVMIPQLRQDLESRIRAVGKDVNVTDERTAALATRLDALEQAAKELSARFHASRTLFTRFRDLFDK
ncbi:MULTISPECIES: sulfotransferase [unclassified Rhodanobacter]|uniref:Sulfotransferase n=1 Tax=Rhodanobacter humi TaxID=1888173 RepID=A0ABV4ATM0_9GAMM